MLLDEKEGSLCPRATAPKAGEDEQPITAAMERLNYDESTHAKSTSTLQQEGVKTKLTTRILPPTGAFRLPDLSAVWRYRDLLFLLIWRDMSARYRQSVVGYGWAFIKPIVSIVIFTFVFGQLAGLPSDGVPYPLFAMAALIPWTFFSTSLSGISSSVVGGAGLFTKVYFPRLILPLASLGSGLAELALQLGLMVLLMSWYGVVPSWQILLLPAFLVLMMSTVLSFGLWLAVLNVKYRDVGHAVPFVLQVWMWMSPVVYTSQIVPDRWRWAYSLNPLVGIIDGFRWCLLGTTAPMGTTLTGSVCVVLATLLLGLVFFERQDAAFADVV